MEFTYRAIQYTDFTSEKTHKFSEVANNSMTFFETEHVDHEPYSSTENNNADVYYTPLKSPSQIEKSPPQVVQRNNMRRSMSTNDLHKLSGEETEVKCGNKSAAIVKEGPLVKKFASIENLNKLAKPKLQDQGNFVSMAEAVKKFHLGTPTRYHSKSRPQSPNNRGGRKAPTQPITPNLATKFRTRPTYVLSTKDRELQEFQEAAKYKIKAHPVSKRMLQGPLKPVPIVKKTPTIPQPFNLTECVKKPVKNEEKVQFHAQNVPKSLHESPFAIKSSGRVTIPEPFSFEARHKETLKKKEAFVKKFIEEEKKAAIFHANPLPKSIAGSRSTSKDDVQEPKGNGADSARKLTQASPVKQFKARPAKVLQMEPFIPQPREHSLTEITEFELNTQKRAAEREQFEQHLKEKERQFQEIRRQMEEQRIRSEEQQKAELRKRTLFVAQPIKKYKEVKIQPANKVTDPVSPKFHYKNKENISQ